MFDTMFPLMPYIIELIIPPDIVELEVTGAAVGDQGLGPRVLQQPHGHQLLILGAARSVGQGRGVVGHRQALHVLLHVVSTADHHYSCDSKQY